MLSSQHLNKQLKHYSSRHLKGSGWDGVRGWGSEVKARERGLNAPLS